MDTENDYLQKNKHLWNERTDYHFRSSFYNLDGFMKGDSSLNEIELALLGDVTNKRILHLQCHFGQDTLSLARLGAIPTGIDLSDNAIGKAKDLAVQLNLDARFICCDIYDTPKYVKENFDIVFTSYGTIGWLPNLDQWASIVAHFLKPTGKFILVEFHPVVWMFNNDFDKIEYSYFKKGAIVESEQGTYADQEAPIHMESVTWNHSIGEVFGALVNNVLQVDHLQEYDYSPYNCFKHTKRLSERKYIIKHLGDKIPMVYTIVATPKKTL